MNPMTKEEMNEVPKGFKGQIFFLGWWGFFSNDFVWIFFLKVTEDSSNSAVIKKLSELSGYFSTSEGDQDDHHHHKV